MRDLEGLTCLCVSFMLGLAAASCSDGGFEGGSGATTGSSSNDDGSTGNPDDGGSSSDDGGTSGTGTTTTGSTSGTDSTTATETTTNTTDVTTTTGTATGTGSATGTGTATTAYCTPEGESHGVYPGAPDCCPGLDSVGCEEPDVENECQQCAGASFCTDCGNNDCGPGENICRCPEDCS